MITLAFYKGRGSTWWERVQDWAIRFATRSPYSHVELIVGQADLGTETLCLSSSGRDGGVREKTILLKPESWDLVELADQPDDIGVFIRDRIGARYDYIGILFSQFFSFGRHSAAKWFCSEICAAALGMPNAQRMSPQSLFDVVSWAHPPLPPEPAPLPQEPPSPPALG